MKFTDLIELAKAGYTYTQVKELLELNVEQQSTTTDVIESSPTQAAVQEPETVTEKVPENEPDYKTMYEESQRKLKEAQQANTKQDMSGQDNTTTDADKVAELMRSFM